MRNLNQGHLSCSRPSNNGSRPPNGRTGQGWRSLSAAVFAVVAVSACSTKPLQPYTAETTPQVLVPAGQAGVQDRRGRFREIFCEVLAVRGTALPDYRPCDEALTRVGEEPAGTSAAVDLGPSRRGLIAAVVPGVGWDCFADWLDIRGSVAAHVRRSGFDQIFLDVDGLSSSASNARLIRDAILKMPLEGAQPRLVLVGYSKGTPDILEAVVNYPEVRERLAAVLSIAGSVGGSPLANDAEQSDLALLQHWPDAQCTPGDGGALESLRPATRKAWLAQHPLPLELPFYSVVAFPEPERVSSVLKSSYDKLSKIDARNDSQMMFYDQVIPGSRLLGYLNADHWALAVPIARTHATLGTTFVNHNDFPREALLEALLRFIEEDLSASGAR